MATENYEHVGKDMAWLRIDSDEWARAWTGLCWQHEEYCGQSRSEVLTAGEGWQYMSTVLYDWRLLGYSSPREHSNAGHTEKWVHEFRNRCLKGKRVVTTIRVESEPRQQEGRDY